MNLRLLAPALAAGVTYVASFFLPAHRHVGMGYEAFWICWQLFPVFTITWLANPLFWTAFVLWFRRRPGDAAATSAAAGVLALNLALLQWSEVGDLKAGYWLWCGSFLVLVPAGWSHGKRAPENAAASAGLSRPYVLSILAGAAALALCQWLL